MRLQKAKELLATMKITMLAVSAATGFRHRGKLTRAFRKLVDLTPAACRAQEAARQLRCQPGEARDCPAPTHPGANPRAGARRLSRRGKDGAVVAWLNYGTFYSSCLESTSSYPDGHLVELDSMSVPAKNSANVPARSGSENLFAVIERSLIGDSAEPECALQGGVACDSPVQKAGKAQEQTTTRACQARKD